MGWSAPPPSPCRTRARIKTFRLGAAPQIAEDAVKIRMQVSRNRFRPNTAPIQAAAGKMMALDTR